MTWQCINGNAQRSSADQFVAAADRADLAKTDADKGAATFADLGVQGWPGFIGPHAASVATIVAAVSTDMTNVTATLQSYAAEHRTAARQLTTLQTQSDGVADRARRLGADHADNLSRLATWRHTRDGQYAAMRYQRLDPAFNLQAAEEEYAASVRQVGSHQQLDREISARLDDAQAEFDEIRTAEDRIHRTLATDLGGITVPSLASTPDGQAMLGAMGPLAAWAGQAFGTDIGDALLMYILGPEGKEALDDIRSEINEDDDLGMSNGELNAVRDHLDGLDEATRAAVLASLTDVELERLFHNVHSQSRLSNDWDDRERTEFYELLAPIPISVKQRLGEFSPYLEALAGAELATDGDRAAMGALEDLRTGDGFTELDFEERAAMLWQAGFYPSEVSIENLERLTEKDWFRDFDLGDTQRSAKMIGFLSSHSSGGDQIIENTLDQFLDEDSDLKFDWDIDPSEGKYGSAGSDEFHFNPRYLDAGDTPVDLAVPSGQLRSDTIHMVTHTVAHEVNHIVNGDQVAESYEYFMGEYRGFYVGFEAEHGHPPTRADVERRVNGFLTASEKTAYGRITTAVTDPTEGPLIADFIDEMLGRDVAASDLITEFGSGVVDGHLPAPVPVSVNGGPNSLDNQ